MKIQREAMAMIETGQRLPAVTPCRCRKSVMARGEESETERQRARQEFERRKLQTLTVAGQSVISRRWRGYPKQRLGQSLLAV